MDYLLPDDETIAKMAEEFRKILPDKSGDVATLSAPQNQPQQSTNILVLYFAFALGYNLGYGTAISNTHRSLGRVQPQKRPFGSVDYFD